MIAPLDPVPGTQNTTPEVQKQMALTAIQTLPADSQKQIALEAMKQLGAADQKDVVQKSGLPAPGKSMADRLWFLVVAGFVLVLVFSFFALAGAIFIKIPSYDVLLTVFTTVAAFLAGLVAPSPVSRNQ